MIDRLKAPFAAMVRSSLPRVDHYALYRGKVLGQSDNTVDVQPDDARLPAMSKVPLRHGLPGVSVSVQPGISILVGWENGDPSRPYACLWEGGESFTEIVIGSSADGVATKKDLQTLYFALTTSVGATGTDYAPAVKAKLDVVFWTGTVANPGQGSTSFKVSR